MKIRKGFISNSSSSSFVLFVDNNTLQKVLETMPKCYTEICKKLFVNKKFLTGEVAVLQDYTNCGGDSYEDEQFEELIYELEKQGVDVSEFMSSIGDENFSWNEKYNDFKSTLRTELRKFEDSSIAISF